MRSFYHGNDKNLFGEAHKQSWIYYRFVIYSPHLSHRVASRSPRLSCYVPRIPGAGSSWCFAGVCGQPNADTEQEMAILQVCDDSKWSIHVQREVCISIYLSPPSSPHYFAKTSPLDFVGTNAYWLPVLNSDQDIDFTLGNISAAGIKVVRTWAFNGVFSVLVFTLASVPLFNDFQM